MASALDRFAARYDFALDDYQVRACRAVEEGRGVLLAAPTGSGKTVVGEFAVHLALEQGRKAFYTTPIKALSNQKFRDLAREHGPERVGLLTGDRTVNGEAPVVVMTTEVLRNMLYAGSPTLAGLGWVVMDEIHYLADPFRGAVWEEVIIHLPAAVSLVSLSATVSNAEELGEWLGTVRGATDVVVEERRPVPLWQYVMAGPRLHDLFVDDEQKRVNPQLERMARDERRLVRGGDRRPARGGHRPGRRAGAYTPGRTQVLRRLAAADLLPCITFVFSRAGCDAAVLQCLSAGLQLTKPQQRSLIRDLVEYRCADIPDEDLHVLGYHDFLAGLESGVAAHHAGMLPTFKEVVEELFARGLVRAVFATETLALGINMPARSVVIERLVKWNGETHADVTPAEYTQLTGRAGRRGIDAEGHAVVLWQPGIDPRAVAGLASTRTYPLRSSFRPSYTMAVNLLGRMTRHRARELLECSFAQFQARRAVVTLASVVRRNEAAIEGYAEAMTCHLGDFAEYADLRRRIAQREAWLAREQDRAARAATTRSLERLRAGDVLRLPSGRFAGLAVVLDPGSPAGPGHGPRLTVLTEGRQVRRLTLDHVTHPVEPLARISVPRSFDPRTSASRRDLADRLRASVPEDAGTRRPRRRRSPAADDDVLDDLGRRLRAHPCHRCAEREDHARWAERRHRLARETDQLQRRLESRTNTVARQFDRVCALLQDVGYLRGDEVTEPGRRLARLYTELDLLTAECLRERLWDGLDPAELAAVVSALTYDARQPDDAPRPAPPPGRVRGVLDATVRLWGELDSLERNHGLQLLRLPDPGFALPAWRWASGHPLESILVEADLTAGDFVRAVKQLIDLLDQIGDAAGDDPLRRTARQAVAALRRGVVDYGAP